MGTIIFGKNVELEYITDGAEMECTFGSMPCNLKTLPKKIVIGGKTGCTIKDNDPIANEFNFGVCSLTQKPCSSLIKLLEWQNAKEDLKIEGASALTEESTIFCTQGGKITFKHSGQFQENKVTTGAEKAKSEYGKASEEKAKLQVTKVAFETSYDICSDDYGLLYEEKNEEGKVIDTKSQDESDYIKTYILEDEGEYYHWLNKRSNPLDDKKYKPDVLPITFASEEPIALKAILRVVSDKKCATTPQVRVTHKTRDKKKYKFKTFSVKPLDDEQYEVVIVSTNLPFEGTIKYLEIFELLFEYSEDGKTWVSAGTSRNTLYVTWKCPLYNELRLGVYGENVNLFCFETGKKLFLETLLYLGCLNASLIKKKKINDDSIIKNIFNPFKGKIITRAREGSPYLNLNWCNEGLGYWRGNSAADGPESFDELRSVQYLLQYGEARCGEWTDFFLNLLLVQGINVDIKREICAICTDYAIIDSRYSQNDYKYRDILDNPKQKSIIFTVKDAIILSDERIIGNSSAQGNDNAQRFFIDHIWVYIREEYFLDPSYGKEYNKNNSNMKKYCKDNISSIKIENKEQYKRTPDVTNLEKMEIIYDNIERYIISTKGNVVNKLLE